MTYQKAVTSTQYYDEIAQALQDNHYMAFTYKPNEMAEGVYDVAKYKYNDGYGKGFSVGEASGIEQGKQAQYDEFWDSIQNNGGRTNYTRFFASNIWTDKWLKVKYDMVASTLFQCFRDNSVVTNLSTKNDGTTLVMDGSSISTSTGFQYLFDGCYALQAVGEIISSADAPWSGAFGSCIALTTITISGTIGKAFNIHWSTKLNDESLLSILQACNKESAGVTITLPANKQSVIEGDTELLTELNRMTSETYGYTVLYD